MKTSGKRIFYTILQIIALGVMLYAGYHLYESYQQEKQEQDLKEEVIEIANVKDSHETIDFQALQQINPEIIGWIYIPDTSIDYPILQTGDNAYYLNHSYDKLSNIFGSIFMDVSNQADFLDVHTLVYGHNVPSGEMFHDLEKYKDENFFKEHPIVHLYTPQQTYELQVLSFYQTKEDSDTYQHFSMHDTSFLNYVKQRQALSMYTTEVAFDVQDSLLTLSTCSYESGKGVNTDLRYVLQTKMAVKE